MYKTPMLNTPIEIDWSAGFRRLSCLLVLMLVVQAARGEEPAPRTSTTVVTFGGSCPRTASPVTDRMRMHGKGTCVWTCAPDATEDRGGYRAIVPGDPSTSLIVQRMISDDDAEQMPPPESNKSVTAEEIEQIKRWIAQGAEYNQHWSLVPPQRPSLPDVPESDSAQNPIDYFVLAQLAHADLKPSPPAERYSLVRRLYLDLLGIPPTPQQADAFVNDKREGAYERLVDQLLASPRYGERWARPWLDLARYSDTNGYEKDRPRTVWPYRDWVIDALNQDMPFDQFTIEQIAGDMLPNATDQQRIATGFHRNTMINEEGGIDPQEFRFLAVVDRVATTGVTWLGLTMGCAQCHSHKYDPISQEEYYQFFALLNNADEPTLDVLLPDNVQQRTRIEAQITELESQLPEHFPLGDSDDAEENKEALRRQHLESRFKAWCNETALAATSWEPLTPPSVDTQAASIDILSDGSVLVSGDQTKNDIFMIAFPGGPRTVTAIRLETLPHESLPEGGPGRRVAGQGASAGVGDFFLSNFACRVRKADGEITWCRSVTLPPRSRQRIEKQDSPLMTKETPAGQSPADRANVMLLYSI